MGRRWKNYGIVDAVWAGGFAWIAVVYLALAARRYYDAKLDAFPEWDRARAVVFTLVIVLWSLRLALHLGRRIFKHHPVEDVRYAELRSEWGNRSDRRMFGFFLLQGSLQWMLSIPFYLALFSTRPPGSVFGWHPLELLGLLICFIGLVGESIADHQLKQYRALPKPHPDGPVCRKGLWRYSRHPNYFFEWTIWVGFALFALPAPYGWMGLVSPLLMWHFLVNVTGIPMTEALSLRSKGDAYREYQRTTNAFFLGPPKGG